MTVVGFIGLGQMGRLMADHLSKAGFSVQSFDSNGSGSCKSAAEAARGAEVLITMLPDGNAVRRAVLRALPALSLGAVLLDMSSSDPATTRELEKILRKKGVAVVDAPVSGAQTGARDASLSIMAGGEARDVQRVMPLLENLGQHIFHTGPVGSGHAMKALNNYIGASGTIAAFEAVLIGKALGLDPALMVEVFNASTGYNSTTQRKLPQQVLTKAFASGFSAALMTKDVSIACELAKRARVAAPYLHRTRSLWRHALRNLRDGADHTEIYRFLQGLSKRPSKQPSGRKPAPSRAARAPRPSPRRSQRSRPPAWAAAPKRARATRP